MMGRLGSYWYWHLLRLHISLCLHSFDQLEMAGYIDKISGSICWLAFLVLMVSVITSSSFSFTSEGTWQPQQNSECDSFLCIPTTNLTWSPTNYKHVFYNNVTACDMLVRKGVTEIQFYGDSYMRHIYAAMLITLNGNFKEGSLSHPENSPNCRYHTQFHEKSCNTLQLNHNGRVCDGRIHLDPLLIGYGNMNVCSKQNGTVVLWSFGNHPLIRRDRYGVNNATAFKAEFSRSICQEMKRAKIESIDAMKKGYTPSHTGFVNGTCSVFWLPTHARLSAYWEDEVPERVHGFNVEMRDFFDNDNCGFANYIDVYNMTDRLSVNHTQLAKQHMSFDHVHWGYEANMQKAQIILNGIAHSP